MKLPDIEIGRSVGAKAKNYDIMDLSTGEMFHFVEGLHLQNVQVFAGKGVKTPLHDGVAEVHWFQEPTVGKVKFKVKRWDE